MSDATTIAGALLGRGYRPSSPAQASFADYWRLLIGDGFSHVALRFDGSLAVYAVNWSGRPVTRAEFPAGTPDSDVLAAAAEAEETLRQAASQSVEAAR